MNERSILKIFREENLIMGKGLGIRMVLEVLKIMLGGREVMF